PRHSGQTMTTTHINTAEKPVELGRFAHQQDELEIDKLFRALVKIEGSDLHLKVGTPPIIRVKGDLRRLNRGPIDDDEMARLILPMFSHDATRRKIFEEDGGVDFAYKLQIEDKKWRFRVNILQQMGSLGMVARRVNNVIPNFKGLYLPDGLEKLCMHSQ